MLDCAARYKFTYMYHCRRAVAQHPIKCDSLSQWRRAKFNPQRTETPEPIAKKIDTVGCVREANPYAKFRATPSTWGLLGKCVKYNQGF